MGFVLAAGRLAKQQTAQNQTTCACATLPRAGLHEARADRTAVLGSPEEGGSQTGSYRGNPVALYSEGKVMIPHCFLEFKSTPFSINIFFNRIFLLFLKDIKTIPISSNTRLYILTRFSQAFFGYLQQLTILSNPSVNNHHRIYSGGYPHSGLLCVLMLTAALK